ncbi:hypothetical protein M406DRAFT_61976 [Cryphonectria parasitica EP155]|uniref:Major facilitator superfamily (MFS) profile domain-containing protein n=1 Tax=Cryphonectria parasitica (strain ATCC 38755 / EP155) TaxID=660469 RepID=A0A9P4Y1Z6_CRYP1|nr:uncharacterized protein M406DRAFT_61976 [Cryphonectria parasitica EP155]KAF3765008.1 hypothetical protein M406DRAFT_61976 [Cryphonectria parasitica EP155]
MAIETLPTLNNLENNWTYSSGGSGGGGGSGSLWGDSVAVKAPYEPANSSGAAELSTEHETYPEGGLQAWLVVFGCWLALIASLGLLNTLATFQTYLTTHQLAHYSDGTVGWIFSLHTFVVFFFGLYIGPLFDKYGPKWIVLAGMLCIVTGMMLFSISTELWHFILSFGVLTGLGCSLIFIPSFAAPGHYFMRRRGFATGFAAMGGSIGGIIFPLMLESLFPRLGWGWSIRIVGFLCLFLCAIASLLIRRRLPPAKNASPHPDFRIFRDRAFLLTTVGVFLMEFALFIPLTYISSYARAAGYSSSLSFQTVPILNAASALGRALPGYWSDIIGPFNIELLMMLLSIVACFAIWLPAGSYTAGLVLFAVLFGFAYGAFVSTTPVCVGRLCKTQQYGRYYATCYTVVSFACLIGVPIAGNILTSDGGAYWGVIVLTGCLFVGAFVCLGVAKGCSVNWKLLAIF